MSIFWLNFLTWFKTAWVYIKKYWGFVVLAVLFVTIMVMNREKSKAISDLLKQQETVSLAHRQELAEIQRIRDEEVRRRAEIEAHYQSIIDKINKDHAEAMAQLTAAKESELRKIIAEAKDDPNVMAERVNALFGIPILGHS